MEKGTRFGRAERESAWQTAEVDALYRLAAAGVRVPRPYGFFDGVLLMELIADAEGAVAPRLAEIELAPELARAYHAQLLSEVVRMLCAGVVHGDLSEFNVLVGSEGPVIIDLPQAMDAVANNHALGMLERDVATLAEYFGRFAPELRETAYGPEIRALFEAGELRPDSVLSGRFEAATAPVDLDALLADIEDVRAEAERRREREEEDDSAG
jgi:RIO kinase 1